jgi:transposase-like protein
MVRSRYDPSAPAGYRFSREVIAVAVRCICATACPTAAWRSCWLNAGSRSITSRSSSGYGRSQRSSSTPPGGRWFLDETYVKVAGRWMYLYRAVDQHGPVIGILVPERRDGAAARAFSGALKTGPALREVTTDRAPVYLRVIDELVPAARHICERHASNRVEADHGRLKARLRPRRGMETTHPLRSQPGARSCRTSAAATTKSPPTCPSTIVCMSRHRARALPLTAAINAPAAALSPSINAAAP